MLDDDDFDAELDAKTPMQRYGLHVAGALFLVITGASAVILLKGGSGPAAKPHHEPHITQVQLPPPPPPPPPPKTPPPPPKQQVVKQREQPSPQKAIAKAAPHAPTPKASVTTSIAGPGNSGLALGNDGGGTGLGTGTGEGGDGSGGDTDGYYSNVIKQRIEAALTRDERLRYAKYRVTISFFLQSSGGFAGATVASFSGDDDARAEVERIIRSESTGDVPAASVVGKQVTVRISEHARGSI